MCVPLEALNEMDESQGNNDLRGDGLRGYRG